MINPSRRVALRALVKQLAEKYPAFRYKYAIVPLKVGVHRDLKAREPDLSDKDITELFEH